MIKRTIVSILIILVALEVGARGVRRIYYMNKGGVENKIADKRYLSPAYPNQPWVKEMFREFSTQNPGERIAFVGRRRGEFQGKYINVLPTGLRKTITQKNDKKVYMFGGSTVWGTGAEDSATIPSWLSYYLEKYEVTNYGQSGYTFLQEVMQLILLLRNGHRPDHVVFYDGVNDVYSAYQQGKISQTQIIGVRKWTPKDFFVRNSVFWRGILKTLKKIRRIRKVKPRFTEEGHKMSEERRGELAKEIVNNFEKTKEVIDLLSQEYDFTYTCFWQPTYYTSKQAPLDCPRTKDEALKSLYMQVTNLLPDWEVDLSNVFPDTFVFIDFCHISGEGNKIIANNMYKELKKRRMLK